MELSTFIILAVIASCGGGSLVGTWWSKKWREKHKKKNANEYQRSK